MPVRFASHRVQPRNLLPLLGITPQWVKTWNRHGLIRGHACKCPSILPSPQGARTEVVLILAGMLLHGCQERVP
jgi:hypothetical protein